MEDMKEFEELLDRIASIHDINSYISNIYTPTDLYVEEYWLDNIKDDENLIKNINDKIENEKIKVSSNDLEKISEMKNMNEKSFLEIFKKSNCKPFNWSKAKFVKWPWLIKEMILFDTERLTIKDIKSPSLKSRTNIISFLSTESSLKKKIDCILDENNISRSVLTKWDFFDRYDLAIKFLLESKININSSAINSIIDIIIGDSIKISTLIEEFMHIENLEDVQRRNIRLLLNKMGITYRRDNNLNKNHIEFLIMNIYQKDHLSELLNNDLTKTIIEIIVNDNDLMDYVMSCNQKSKKSDTKLREEIFFNMIKYKSVAYPKLIELTKKYKIQLSRFSELLAIDTLEGSYVEDFLRYLNNVVKQFIKGEMQSISLNVSFEDLSINIDCDHKDEVNLLLDVQRYKDKENI